MQRVHALVGPVHLRAFVVHAIARQAGRGIEAVALVGPPAVDPEIEQRLVHRPVATHLAVGRPAIVRRAAAGERRGGAGVVHRAGHLAAFDHGVQDHLEVLGMQLVDRALRVGERFGVPGELAVVGVPSVGAEVRAQVDHRVARQLLLAEEACLLKDLFGRAQRAVRLLVAERPQRRHFGKAGNLRVFGHNHRRVFRLDDEEVDRQRAFGSRRL